MLGAAVVAAVSVPVFMWAMPWLVKVVFGEEYEPAVAAARIVLVAAALQLVFGWTKSFPVTIGRPGLRILAHGIETAVLLPLVAALGAEWGVTGAAWAILAASVVFVVTWAFLLLRVRAEVAARAVREPALAP
jgi:O-antigen/teichoic acid export membrane protein